MSKTAPKHERIPLKEAYERLITGELVIRLQSADQTESRNARLDANALIIGNLASGRWQATYCADVVSGRSESIHQSAWVEDCIPGLRAWITPQHGQACFPRAPKGVQVLNGVVIIVPMADAVSGSTKRKLGRRTDRDEIYQALEMIFARGGAPESPKLLAEMVAKERGRRIGDKGWNQRTLETHITTWKRGRSPDAKIAEISAA
jgi:hypothetical protein